MARLIASGRILAWTVPVLAEAAALARSIAFAWATGPEELGRAMMLALTVRLVEMASDVGIDRLIVQAPDGNSAALQSGLHGTALVRGVLSGLIILGLAPVLAGLLSDGPGAMSYAVLAAIPMIRGFVHLDFRRAERRFSYGGMAVVEAGATLGMILCMAPALWLLGDHRAMSAVLIAHAAIFTLLSQCVATRRYRFRVSLAMLRRSWTFGWPLVLNALLLFATFYADRLIVAGAYDWTALALYGVALQLALLPAQIVGRAAASLVLPAFRQSLSRGGFDRVWRRVFAMHALMACAMMLGFALIAPPVIALIYGAAFRPDTLLAGALAVAAGFRILRTPFSQLAIAAGRTADPARANIIRAAALVPAAAFAAAGLPLAAIAVAAALGEAGATLRAFQLAAATPRGRDMNEVFA
ncbi:MAG: oligosaccharide flippase family protein [Silicimonas sp.]